MRTKGWCTAIKKGFTRIRALFIGTATNVSVRTWDFSNHLSAFAMLHFCSNFLLLAAMPCDRTALRGTFVGALLHYAFVVDGRNALGWSFSFGRFVLVVAAPSARSLRPGRRWIVWRGVCDSPCE